MNSPRFLLTCEHSSHQIPAEFRSLFRGEKKILRTHRGWDDGAKELAVALGKSLSAPVILGGFSRLLVDLNRTEDNKGVFSEWTRPLGEEKKEKLIRDFHRPHWNKVRRAVKKMGNVIHVGVHSFVPVLHGRVRRTDIGLLHDPRRKRETDLCLELQKNLRQDTAFAIHRNLPYRGTGNGLVAALREELSPEKYLGLELEINQRCFREKNGLADVHRALMAAFSQK